LSGTNAATAPISFLSSTGDDPEDAGFTVPGSGDDLTFSSTSNTDKSGTVRLTADDGTSISSTAAKPWVLTATTTPPPPTDRDLFIESDWETGQCQAMGNVVAGVHKDSCNLHQAGPVKTLTVTNITKANPAVMSWTGTDPSVYEGVSLGVISSGMTQISRRLVRCQPTGYDASGNSCRLFIDGDMEGVYNNPDGVCRSGATNSCTPVNSTSFGTWSGTSTGTTWERLETQGGGLGPTSPLLVRVVKTKTAVTTGNGAATGNSNPITPLLGNFFMYAQLDYWRDHSTFPGNSNLNKVRWVNYGDGNVFGATEEVCASVGVFLPSNYVHKNSANVSFGSNEHINFPMQGDNVTALHVETSGTGTGSAVDHWFVDFDNGPGRTRGDLGSVVPDLDKWTVFTIRFKPSTTNGTLKVWKSTGAYITGKQRTDTLVYTRTSGPLGSGQYRFHLRQYNHSWHHHAGIMEGYDQSVSFDELRLTRFVADGGTCADVHPFGVNLN